MALKRAKEFVTNPRNSALYSMTLKNYRQSENLPRTPETKCLEARPEEGII
jgi:hypothetical protein